MHQTYDVFIVTSAGDQMLLPIICESEADLIRRVRMELENDPGSCARVEFMGRRILTLES
jgi:hypothetical protein